MWNKLSSVAVDLFTAGVNWFYIVYKAEAFPDFHWIWFFFIVYAVWLSSGFLSATIAEMKSHNMKLHFCMGLLLPYAYPFLLLNHLKKKAHVEKTAEAEKESDETYSLTAKLMGKIEEKEVVKQAKIDARRLLKEKAAASAAERFEAAGGKLEAAPMPVEAAPTPAPAPKQPEVEAAPYQFTRGFFESLSVDEAGNRVGPFSIKLKDNSTFTAETIKLVQDDLAIFEVVNKNGEIKNIRIKFANFVSCEKMN